MVPFLIIILVARGWVVPAVGSPGRPDSSGCSEVRPVFHRVDVERLKPLVAGQLAGTVEDRAHRPIPGSTVEIVDEQGKCSSASIADPHGHFDLGISKAGKYRLRISKDYYEVLYITVSVKTGAKRLLRIELDVAT